MKHALIIGDNKYDDPKLAQLKTPAADSQALAKIPGVANILVSVAQIAIDNSIIYNVFSIIAALCALLAAIFFLRGQ